MGATAAPVVRATATHLGLQSNEEFVLIPSRRYSSEEIQSPQATFLTMTHLSRLPTQRTDEGMRVRDWLTSERVVLMSEQNADAVLGGEPDGGDVLAQYVWLGQEQEGGHKERLGYALTDSHLIFAHVLLEVGPRRTVQDQRVSIDRFDLAHVSRVERTYHTVSDVYGFISENDLSVTIHFTHASGLPSITIPKPDGGRDPGYYRQFCRALVRLLG